MLELNPLRAEAVRSLAQSLAWMPDGACRDYWSWALHAANATQREEWLQISGLSAIVRLYERMFARFLSAQEQRRLAPFAATIIVQQTYEVISDNLAIGLAGEEDSTSTAKRQVLAVYNQVMIDTLAGAGESVVRLMTPARAAASTLSAFEHNHNPDKTKMLARAFSMDSDRRAALANDLWPALVASCEATLALSRCLSGTPVGVMVSDGLAARYAGVSALIAGGELDLAARLRIGADTILVRPTLAFFAGVIAQEVRPMRNWPAADKTLAEALADSAWLVRLLNDIGTELLTARDMAPYLSRLRSAALRHRDMPLRELFGSCIGELGPAFNRIHKDVALCEFNVALDSTCRLADFITDLGELRTIYAQRSRSLRESLAALSEQLGDSLVGDIIDAFVQFHAQLYLHRFEDARGEFAV